MINLAIGRLKIAHVTALMGDAVMILAGFAGIKNWTASAGIGDLSFIIGGATAFMGHLALMLKPKDMPAGLRLLAFIIAGLCYAVSGIGLNNYPFMVAGLLVCGTAVLGWLVPRGGKIGGSSKAQAISGLLVISTLFTYTAAVQCDNMVLFTAAILFTICNVADYFTRKASSHG